MTREQLAQYDGRDGRPAFICVSGKIYDVSQSPLWKGGDHQGQHQAGADLTEELKGAPHVRAVIERFPVVGTLDRPILGQTPPDPRANRTFTIISIVGAILLVVLLLLFR